MADFLNTTSVLGGTPLGTLDMVPIYIQKKLLMILTKKLVFHQLADKEDLPQGQGKTARWVRYERIGLPFTPNTDEGITPALTRQQPISVIEATVDQWMDGMVITDVAELTVYHKAFQIMIERLATQAAEVVDREIQRVLLSSSSIVFPDISITDRSAITVGSVVSTDVIRRVLAALRDYGAPDFNSDFVGVFDPHVEMDISKDPTFQTAQSYQNMTPLMNGEVGKWMGVRWMRSNFIPAIVADTNVDVTPTTPAASGGETALAANQDIQIVGLDAQGFETHVGTITTPGAFTAGDIIEFTLPALPAGVLAYNVYAGLVGGTLSLQATAVGPGVYHLTAGTVAAAGTNIQLSTTGNVPPIQPAANVSIHQTYIFGREAFGDLELTNIETMLTPNVASDSDPFKQRRKATWKALFKAVIKNSNFFRRIESSSAF